MPITRRASTQWRAGSAAGKKNSYTWRSGRVRTMALCATRVPTLPSAAIVAGASGMAPEMDNEVAGELTSVMGARLRRLVGASLARRVVAMILVRVQETYITFCAE